jgi:hypothetical protein
MEISRDGLAGIVDLFGALTRSELQSAAAELAFKRDGEFEPDTFGAAVDAAIRSYHLLEAPPEAVSGTTADADGDASWLVPGPIAFPELPADASDLPHILDVDDRDVDRPVVARVAEERFRADAAAAVDAGDSDRLAELGDVSYELETWGDVDLSSLRSGLDAAGE